MKELPKEKFVPHINGKYRFDFLYPRIQVKILNEKIFLIGIKEGVEPILELNEKLEKMNFGNITFNIDNINYKVYKKSFVVPRLLSLFACFSDSQSSKMVLRSPSTN